MDFRLIYQGPLPAQGSGDSRKTEKHAIRKELHKQLREVWDQHYFLKRNLDFFAEQYKRFGFRFVPLVNREQASSCKLDILFLRRDHPGNLIRTGGDIDNRIKVLFDGLRIANCDNELSGAVPGNNEDPFFCLLEDDSLITDVNIVTDRLYTPVVTHQHDVVLVIRVKTKPIDIDDL